ncbi:DUF3013 family protein [Enterococcus sp. LJL120]
MKKDFLHYLDERLETISDYEVALDWDTKNHTIEIFFRLYAENTEGQAIDDADGVVSEEEVIEFEDGILLFNPEKSRYQAEDYLKAFPYEGKKGLSIAFLNGLVDYLQIILDEGQGELLDFLAGEAEVFELHWNEQAFSEEVEKYAKELATFLPYPSY